LSEKINIKQNCGPNKTGNETDDFLAKTKEISRKIFGYLGQKSCRLAFIAKLMFEEMSNDELENCYNKLFIPLPMYESNPPHEWNNYSVSRKETSLADTQEIVNIITEIKRARGQMLLDNKSTEIDRIRLHYEFNTILENKDTRFDTSQLDAFLDMAKDNYNSAIRELEGVINA
jgi:hypothetical protein